MDLMEELERHENLGATTTTYSKIPDVVNDDFLDALVEEEDHSSVAYLDNKMQL